ncbi:hypothetical protein [Vibrio vulnificus]|uniref:hypothetical protein n=1 Tax=Vibrio vulnificus TaxID=672 RepID=UPI0028B48BE3|nr:hypothetical protein [Vibrio vulnificus]
MGDKKPTLTWLEALAKFSGSQGINPISSDIVSSKPVSQSVIPLSKLEELIQKAGRSELQSKSNEDKEHPEEHEKELALSEQEREAYEDPSVGESAIHEIERMKAEADAAKVKADACYTDAQTELEKAKTEIMRWIAKETFFFMKCWCGFVAIIFWMYFGTKQGDIEKEVIIALLGTTTISIVGLVGFIVRGLFGVKEDKPAKENKK